VPAAGSLTCKRNQLLVEKQPAPGGTHSINGECLALDHKASAATGLGKSSGQGEEMHWCRFEVGFGQASEVGHNRVLQLFHLQ
jgi:hypothetical protein